MINKKLPKDWKIVKVGKYVISTKGKKPKRISKEKTNECYLPYVNIKAFEKGIVDEYTDGVGCVICEEGDFLMVWDGSRSGYVGKAIKGALGSTLVRLNFPDLENNYAYYFLQSKYIEINTRAKGVGIPHVDPNLLWNYYLLIPPLETQQAIVSKIEELFSELDKGIEDLKTAQQQLKTYRQSVLKWAFEGKLTNENVKEGELPEGWEMVNMSKVIEKPKYGTSKKCDYTIKGIGVLRIPNIAKGIVDSTDLKFAKFDEKEIETYSLKEGDILTIRSNGSVDLVGKCALISKKDEGYLYAGYLIRLRPIINKVNPKYLINILTSIDLRNQIEEKAKSTSGVNNINSEELSTLKIQLPPIEEQHRIVQEIESRLSVADKMEESIAQSLQQAEALRQSILKKAFSGELV
ncbi:MULTISPECIES: restriction endonuclease subunit S [Flavobacterium]|uniref:Restriction endonuclease subunit S n=1 Tax=Flavobacterium keumense TaxID=1306518 RepID=A0ABY8NA73_9FLAO|nr:MULTISPECIES: restriction endonuclease subunit S [Flavobacterium]WGK95127.1 restriction endonuclease subunit S [Flavobacterium keumense]